MGRRLARRIDAFLNYLAVRSHVYVGGQAGLAQSHPEVGNQRLSRESGQDGQAKVRGLLRSQNLAPGQSPVGEAHAATPLLWRIRRSSPSDLASRISDVVRTMS